MIVGIGSSETLECRWARRGQLRESTIVIKVGCATSIFINPGNAQRENTKATTGSFQSLGETVYQSLRGGRMKITYLIPWFLCGI